MKQYLITGLIVVVAVLIAFEVKAKMKKPNPSGV